MEKSLYSEIVSAGQPVDNHYSDLYFPVNEKTTAILASFPESWSIAKCFKNQIDGATWYDVPFAFLPYWEAKQKKV